MPVDDQLFYIRDSRTDTGSSAVFWNVDGGYTSNLRKAEKFPRDKAVRMHSSRETDIPLRCDLVDQLAYLAVDCQLVKTEEMAPTETDQVVYQVPKRWDGNNIMFASDIGHSYDYGKARCFDSLRADTDYIPLSKVQIDAIARPVVSAHLVPTREFLRKARIKMNSRLLAKNNRPCSGKHRSNCPECGRIVWDHNPYETFLCKRCEGQ